jgi:hypothetical protein
MISNCPHCQGALKFNAAQLAKIQQALKALPAGKRLPLKCPHCKVPMLLDSAGAVEGSAQKAAPPRAAATEELVKPPPPPNLDWLKEEKLSIMENVRDVPMALVLHSDEDMRHQIQSAMESLGYQTLAASSPEDAMHQVASSSFACIVFHSGFENCPLSASVFHNHMRNMLMSKRRYIFYILMGPEFISLYDIQALAHSANLVVNDQDLKDFQVILHRSIPYYEELFGPLLEELAAYGKK